MSTITTTKTIYKVSDFVSWQRSRTLVLSPEFQRRPVWKSGAKSFLIDTIVRGFPIPIIFIRDIRTNSQTFEPNREIIDGQQRLRTVLSFIDPELLSDFTPRDIFTVTKTHNAEIAGKSFKEISSDLQQKILDYEFNIHVLPTWVDDRDVLQIFRRMNSTSYALKPQELRNSQYFGEFKTSMYLLAAQQLNRWRSWRTFTEDEISRMEEVELTSEIALVMLNQQIEGKSSPRIDKVYDKYDEDYPERLVIEERFSVVMDSIEEKIGKDMNDLPFGNKRLIYSLITVFYDLLYGIKSDLKKAKAKTISPEQVSEIKRLGERIKNRTAPQIILDATDRRTTNPKERRALVEYLVRQVKRA
jgi:uncharacterized protein with ParB-like and HNH nuclease domain